ncbi:MAG TPA: methyltransferase domain-containing protein [Pyrinomonadaceae bacterium]|nr:methyltransferase domain-containing protein [Pyrinomonadaceae bacterium]
MDAQIETDGLDLAQLMSQIRKDAENRKRNSFSNGDPARYRQLILQNFNAFLAPQISSLPPLQLQPELENRDRYHINDLLGFHDEVFVRNAYKVILKREPDDSGMAHFLKNLRNGRYSKLDVLSALRFSSEGANVNIQIEGLSRRSVLRRMYRVPVAGYLLRLAVAIGRLPVLITNFRRVESHSMAQLDRVATHINEAVAHLSHEMREQSKANRTHLEALRTHFESLQQQLNDLKATLQLQINSLIREQEKFAQIQNVIRQNLSTTQSELSLRIDLTTHHAREQEELQERSVAELQALKAQVEKQIDDLIERLQRSRMDLAQQETRLSRLLDGADSTPSAPAQQPAHPEQDHLLDSLYFSLEDVLRGTPEQIKEEVKVYLPVLENAGMTAGILDVGCGRGEWLQVLREAGLQARGIDTNRILVQQCKELSLDVEERDALEFLGSLADGSLNAVTAFHFAEHLPLETLVKFLDEAGRTLKPGGLIILETPNPENLLVGSCNFYLDPTHKNPIPIPTMKLLLEARGFRCEEVLKLHAVESAKIEVKDQLTSHLNHFLYGPMNYAVIARKPESE